MAAGSVVECMLDLRSKGHCFDTYPGHLVVSLGKKLNPLLYFCVNPGLQKKPRDVCGWRGRGGGGGVTLIVIYDT